MIPTDVPIAAFSATLLAALSLSEMGETSKSFSPVTPTVKLLLVEEPSLEIAVTVMV